jgi:23S rRNA pseudouridine1911/1915/1917 synthase
LTSKRTELIVTPELGGRPLDGVVRDLLVVPWAKARQLIETGKIDLGGDVVTDTHRVVRRGDRITFSPNAPRRDRCLLDPKAIVYVDPHLVVVRKPPYVSTVPFEKNERGTLDQMVAAVLHRRGRAGGPPASLGVVQRLDKSTSGLIVFARSWAAKQGLASQLRWHTVTRRYLAIAHGSVKKGTFRSHLVENRGDRLRGSSRLKDAGRLAVTHVEPVEVLRGATLVACRLETGRTHQIRIHLAESGHPLVGERVYVRDYTGELIDAPRVMLHAAGLGFEHPVTGQRLDFEDPPPPDFEKVLARLRTPR